MKKIILSIIILLVFGSAAFIWGWLEFFVPVDSVGVMVSKTGGVKPEIIQAGNFTWSWERLIPTNTKISVFSLEPKTYTTTIQGSLPSAEIYSAMLEGNPNFDYNFSVSIQLNARTETLAMDVYKMSIENQEELDSYLEEKAQNIARSTMNTILDESMNDTDYVVTASYSDAELIRDAQDKYPNLSITSIHINNVTLPDLTMYTYAKNIYATYQEAAQEAINEAFELQGYDAAQDYLEFERLAKLGELLKEYPHLIEYEAIQNGNFNFMNRDSDSGNTNQ